MRRQAEHGTKRGYYLRQAEHAVARSGVHSGLHSAIFATTLCAQLGAPPPRASHEPRASMADAELQAMLARLALSHHLDAFLDEELSIPLLRTMGDAALVSNRELD